MTADQLAKLLAGALGEGRGPLLASNVYRCAGSAFLRFGDGTRVPIVDPSEEVLSQSLHTLLERARPAAFGKGKATKIDRRVRDGLQLLARDWGLAVEGIDLEHAGVLDEVWAALMPNSQDGLCAELYAVNLYGPGGHFGPHKDTPRGKDMVATLVLGLPWAFEGGALVLTRGEETVRWDWEGTIAPGGMTLPWVAFFADVDHEIFEVRRGHRATLTFVLRRVPSAKPTGKRAARGSRARLTELFRRAAADPEAAGATFRVECVHQYAVDAKTPAVRPIETVADAGALKARDAEVALAALDAGLDVAMVHCLLVRTDDGVELNARLDAAPSDKALPRLRRSIEKVVSGVGELDCLLRGDPDHVVPIGEFSHARFVLESLYSFTGYYGNEALEAGFYVSAALDVTVPKRGNVSVVHPKFGHGKVLEDTGEGVERRLRVRFESGEERVLLARFVRFT